MRIITTALVGLGIAFTIHCGADSGGDIAPAQPAPGDPRTPPPPGFGDGAGDGGSPAGCVAPDMLIALDHTLTMSRRPDGTEVPNTAKGRAQTRFAQAIDAIHRVTGASLDTGIRFGLELWPKTEEGCATLETYLGGAEITNERCQGAETVVVPALGAGAAIASALDVRTTKICRSTPTGPALLDAKVTLDGLKDGVRRQYVVLVTDGADWDRSCPDPDPVEVVDQLAAAGVETLLISFSAERADGGSAAGDQAFLNDLACAGHSAKGFPDSCEKRGDVYRAKPGETGVLYYPATNGDELLAGLSSFAQNVCCNCVK